MSVAAQPLRPPSRTLMFLEGRAIHELGAFLGALLVGLVDTLGRSFSVDVLRLFMAPSPARTVGPAIASMLIYLLMALVLYFRPAGLFPAKGRG